MDSNRQSRSFRRSIRLRGYDYSQAGAYFVTLCTYRKACLFGEIVGADMQLSTLGTLVCLEWQRTAQVRQSVDLDAFIVMPNHLHGIIVILEDAYSARSQPTSELQPQRSRTLLSSSLGAIIGQFKSAVTRQARRMEKRDLVIWQRNFYEHVISRENSLNDIRQYIVENPARWTEDSLYLEQADG